jgi:hypothetical protein
MMHSPIFRFCIANPALKLALYRDCCNTRTSLSIKVYNLNAGAACGPVPISLAALIMMPGA